MQQRSPTSLLDGGSCPAGWSSVSSALPAALHVPHTARLPIRSHKEEEEDKEEEEEEREIQRHTKLVTNLSDELMETDVVDILFFLHQFQQIVHL